MSIVHRTAADVDSLHSVAFSEFPEDYGWVRDPLGFWRPPEPPDGDVYHGDVHPVKKSTRVVALTSTGVYTHRVETGR